MIDEKIADFFARASGLGENELMELKEKNPEKVECYRIQGMKLFKRKMLGICGKKAVKSMDEISSALYELGIIPSLEHGKPLIAYLDNKDMNMGERRLFGIFSSMRYLTIKEIDANAKKYQVSAWYDFDPNFDDA